jgi:geranylgeranyl pyrophosphate synthase
MAEISCLPAVGLKDKMRILLVAVEGRMHDALRPDQGLLAQGQMNARSAALYHLQSGGRRVRARLALSAGMSLGLSKADVVCIASCVELLHNASLVHDDIQDRDVVRRGQAAVWSKFGNNLAICTGDFLLSAAYGVLCTISQPLLLPAMLTLLHERTATAIDGQCADLATLSGQAQGLAAYIQIATAKSGALLSLPLELALLAAGRADVTHLARQACENLAVSYQILDDLQDLEADSPQPGDGVDPTQSLNIVGVLVAPSGLTERLNKGLSQAAAMASAQALGLAHLAICDSLALQLPSDSGAQLVALSAELRCLLNAQAWLETC